MVTYPWSSIGIAHLLENGCRERILADVVKRADCGMSLHIRLPCKDEYLQPLGKAVRSKKADHDGGGNDRIGFYGHCYFLVETLFVALGTWEHLAVEIRATNAANNQTEKIGGCCASGFCDIEAVIFIAILTSKKIHLSGQLERISKFILGTLMEYRRSTERERLESLEELTPEAQRLGPGY